MGLTTGDPPGAGCCERDIAYRIITGNQVPDHNATIARAGLDSFFYDPQSLPGLTLFPLIPSCALYYVNCNFVVVFTFEQIGADGMFRLRMDDCMTHLRRWILACMIIVVASSIPPSFADAATLLFQRRVVRAPAASARQVPAAPVASPASPTAPAAAPEPKIVGTDYFQARVREALQILQAKAPTLWDLVQNNLSTIGTVDGCVSSAYVWNGTAIISSCAVTSGPVWLASVIVHEAYHVQQYRDGRPYYGLTAEAEAFAVQRQVLTALGASSYDLYRVDRALDLWYK